MIQKIVAFALANRLLVGAFAALLVIAGLVAFDRLPIEAYPNPVPPLVEVIVQPPGWSAEEVERYVTIPVEIGLSGMPGLDHIRSQSLFGLSDVKCYFKWGIEYKDARQEVINRLQFIQMPGGLQPQISPWNAIGEVFRYEVRSAPGHSYSLRELKTAEDWILERQFKQVPGVIDVTSFGGETKEYHVEVDPVSLRARGISLQQLNQAISNANQNVGGQRLVLGEQAYTVRGVGLLQSVRDIGDVVITEKNGVAVRISDVAKVSIGAAPRLGQVGRDNDGDIVQGTILMRYGAETAKTLKGIHERIELIRKNKLLPPGMILQPYYDRGWLVSTTTSTVMENLLIGMGLVTLILLAFLGNVRAALCTAVTIPLALLCAFCGLVGTGSSANLISLGAVDFGIVVNSAVIMVENIFRHLGSHGKGSIRDRMHDAATEVGRPMAFSTLIIAVAFLPLLTMTGVSGVILSPMAMTYAFAIGGAVLISLTITPVLVSLFVPASMEEKETFLIKGFNAVYRPLFDWSRKRPKTAFALGLIPLLAPIALFPLLGREFMPKLEEGNFWIRATLPTSVSLETTTAHVGRLRKILLSHPEIVTVVSQVGRPDDGTDVAGFGNIELFAPLKAPDQWPKGLTKEKLTDILAKELQDAAPGMGFNFSQYISDNVEEAISGVKGENSVKVVGPDINKNEATADAIVDQMNKVRGIKDIGLFRSLGQPSIRIVPDRVQCQRYGLNTGDVEAVIQAAVGGQAVTNVYEGEKSFALTVRWLPKYRSSVPDLKNIAVSSPDGSQIPLGQLATITEEDSPAVIFREDGSRYSPVKFSVRGRDLSSAVTEAQLRTSDNVSLPPETHLEWGGEINELNEAFGRLQIVIPITLLLMMFLIYSAVKTWIDTVLVLASIPLACTGGVLALLVTGENFSISAAMGFVSIFGIAIEGAILVVSYAQRRRAEGQTLEDAAFASARQLLRPMLMTTLVAMLGLLPAAMSNGIGAQSQKPLAIVVIGGSLSLALLTQVLAPTMMVFVHRLVDKPKHELEPEEREAPQA